MDRKFKHFEDVMEKERQRSLQEHKDSHKEGQLAKKTYSKQSTSVESSELEVDGHHMKFILSTYTKEKDGIKVPYIYKQITCEPPAPADFIRSHTETIWETIGGCDKRVFS